jgi:hypothetical protein
MTLLVRLLWAIIAGAIIAFLTYKILWPRPLFVGEFHSNNKRGDYILRLDEDLNAVIIFTDKKKKRFAYKGHLSTGTQPAITWSEQRKLEEWIPLEKPVVDRVVFNDENNLIATEGEFTRSK